MLNTTHHWSKGWLLSINYDKTNGMHIHKASEARTEYESHTGNNNIALLRRIDLVAGTVYRPTIFQVDTYLKFLKGCNGYIVALDEPTDRRKDGKADGRTHGATASFICPEGGVW